MQKLHVHVKNLHRISPASSACRGRRMVGVRRTTACVSSILERTARENFRADGKLARGLRYMRTEKELPTEVCKEGEAFAQAASEGRRRLTRVIFGSKECTKVVRKELN